jgi:hypothetical protein
MIFAMSYFSRKAKWVATHGIGKVGILACMSVWRDLRDQAMTVLAMNVARYGRFASSGS